MTRLIQHRFEKISILLMTLILSGCSTLSYYGQSIQGELEVLAKRQSIDTILQHDDISDELRGKLETILQLRDFSIKQLSLPKNDSYLSYADLGRDYVIWNIFANEEFSLKPLSWCYLIVGCLSYRGYFSKAKAKRHAKALKSQGYDIYLGGVSAYSTLGWFDDPILNTMLKQSDAYLATVMFHELAHQKLYIKNDTEFNESFADTIAHIGVTKWLESKPDKSQLMEYKQAQYYEKAFVNLVNRYKSKLNQLYQSSQNEEMKRKHKKRLFTQMRAEYIKMTEIGGQDPYKNWFASDINNAKLSSVVTYKKYVPDFLAIYKKLKKNLPKFYSLTQSLSNCEPIKRRKILQNQKIKFEC